MPPTPLAPARRPGPVVLALVTALVFLAACSPGDGGPADAQPSAPPARAADVEGTVAGTGDAARLVDASDAYYEGMGLLSAGTVVVGDDGTALTPGDLTDGDAVEVWTDACAESYPVQCEVVAVRVAG
ncbi:hypothetical protein [Cellulosimicrobium composti]|uniref:DUF5666 domain-containing protein n=1 Tax=Cellulosimicrobium composti TaxID=2672572 RepID=A0ABX0B5B8_9MICO|nr:hypothetical protein [Cellulosimicrobium composti]NDO88077.1 hypothetical protein [Cellulosimicrobium composti]